MENGWIKIHRKIKDKAWFKRSEYVHLWVYILIKANHEEKEFIWNGSTQRTKKGEFITGRNALVKETGIAATTIERILNLFEKDGQIGQQKNNKFRLITVKKWEEYQSSGHQTDIKRTSSGHLADTNKNIRIKELKESISMVATAPDLKNKSDHLIEEMRPIIQELIGNSGEEQTIRREANKFHSYWTEPNKSKTRLRWEMERTWDTKRRLQTWFSRVKDDFKNNNPPNREVL